MKNISTTKGFTLIELLLYVTLSGVLLFGVTILFLSLGESRNKQFAVDNVENEAGFILEKFEYLVGNAISIQNPTPASTSTTLVFKYPTSADTASLYLTGTTLYLERNGIAQPLNSTKTQISTINFVNNSTNAIYPSIKINFTMNALNPSGRSDYDYTNTFYATTNTKQQ